MDFEGKVIAIQEKKREGTDRNGYAFRIDVVVLKQDRDRFPKSLAVEVYSTNEVGKDKWGQWQLRVGDKVKAYVDTEAREVNGTWFNSMRVFKIEKWQSYESQQVQQPQQYPSNPQAYQQPAPPPPPQVSQQVMHVAGMFGDEFGR